MKTAAAMVWAFLLVAGMEALGAETNNVQVAYVNIDQISQGVGWENMNLLMADAETKEILTKLMTEMKSLYAAILKEEDEVQLAPLRDRYQSLEQKLQWLKSKANRSGTDPRKAIGDFVRKEFGKEFAIISVNPIQGLVERYGLIQFNVTTVDITDRVIARLKETGL